MKRPRILIDLDEYIDAICESETHTLSGTFMDDEDNEQIINVLSDDMFRNYFNYFFYSYSMVSVEPLNDDIIIDAFNNFWNIFQNEEQENIDKIVQGYYWDYVPVYNYDRTEHWVDVKSGSESDDGETKYGATSGSDTTTGKITDTNTPAGSYRDTTSNGQTVRTDQVATMDSQDNFMNDNRSTVNAVTNYTERTYSAYSETNERTYTNHKVQHSEATHKDEHDNTHTYDDVTDVHDGRMFGNIGVTTNVDMITQELEMRVHNLGYEFMKRFFDKFFCMV